MTDYIVLESQYVSEMRDLIDVWSAQGFTLLGPVTVVFSASPVSRYLATMEKANDAPKGKG